jgi:hypothetical protein
MDPFHALLEAPLVFFWCDFVRHNWYNKVSPSGVTMLLRPQA